MRRSDKLAIKAERHYELFVKHFRLAIRHFKAYETVGKRADKAGTKELEAEDFDLDRLRERAKAAQPWPKKKR